MCKKQNASAFITNDFIIQDFDFSNIERYELTSCLKSGEINPADYGFSKKDKQFTEWANENLSYEELYEVPMMNTIYYYPSFVTFAEEDRYKTASTTTLFYDTKLDCWAMGLTGGGMDLSPHLLDTFISLNKGIPFNIAEAISKSYTAYIDKEKHLKNCQLLAIAFQEKATSLTGYSQRLKN